MIAMSKGLLGLALVWTAAPGCSSRYGKPAALAPAAMHVDSEAGLADDRLVVDGLVEFADSLVLSHRPKGTGRLTISPERIGWSSEDDDERSFSIRPAAVKSVTMECVIRAGGNICLEMSIETITGLTYRFRDIDWAGGYNERIRRAHDYLQRNFPRVIFAETAVEKIR